MEYSRSQSLRPQSVGRHTGNFRPRSSPLAGPVLSSDGTRRLSDDDGDSKRRYRPSRITSTPDLQGTDSSEGSDERTSISSRSSSTGSLHATVAEAEHEDKKTVQPSPSVSRASSRRSTMRRPKTAPEQSVPSVPAWVHRTPRHPSTSRDPDQNWMTATTAPKFTRLGLGGKGVVMPVSACSRRLSASSTSSRTSVAMGKSQSAPASPQSSVDLGSRTRPPLPKISISPAPPAMAHTVAHSPSILRDRAPPRGAPPSPTELGMLPSASSGVPSLTRSESSDADSVFSARMDSASTATVGSIGTLAVDPMRVLLMSHSTPYLAQETELAGKKKRFSRISFGRGRTEQHLAPSVHAPSVHTATPEDERLGEHGLHQLSVQVFKADSAQGKTGIWRRFVSTFSGKGRIPVRA